MCTANVKGEYNLNLRIMNCMKNKITTALAVLICLACSLRVCAQEFPVQVTAVLPPPYSLYLSDYTAPESNLQLIINLRELDRPEYKVKLRLTIEGQGITLTTKNSYQPQAIVLQGGVAEMLTGPDIKNYFNPDNLDFTGIAKQDFIKKGALPEGFYTFKFEVVDYLRNVTVSNPGFANAWLILNDPPIINLPFNNDKVVATDPQNVTFSWTPRHTASPNAAFTTEYEFTMVELYPDNRNPNDAIRVGRPIFTTKTSLTSLNYSITETLLTPGRKYAFRVKAYDVDGKDLFKNSGYSEVFVFQFGDACIPPAGVKAEALDEARIKLTWDALDIHTAFGIQYRKKGGQWNDQSAFTNSVIIPGLLAKTTYEYQIKGTCGTIQGAYSVLASITTPESAPNEFTCGATPPGIELKTTPLINPLQIDDLIKTADFEISITEVEKNPDNSYKGKGKAFLPWFNFATVMVKFNDIKVNEDYRVYSGNVTTVYTKSSKFIANVDLKRDQEDKEAAGPESGGNAGSEPQIIPDTVTIAADVKSISVDLSSHPDIIVVVAEDGTTQEIPREKDNKGEYKDTVVKDSKGDTWIVGKDGKVSEGPSTPTPDAVASLADVDYTIKFASTQTQDYGFDTKDSPLGTYENATIRDKAYDTPWKSVETGRQDRVAALAGDESSFPAVVGFKSDGGAVPSQPSANAAQKEIIVQGKVAGTQETISAYVTVKESDSAEPKEVELGRLNVVTYDKIRKKVVIIPVNMESPVTADEVKAELNAIYKQAVVEWDVEIGPKFEYEPNDLVGLDAEESDWLSSFPTKMQVFNRTFTNTTWADKDSYYLFVVKGTQSKRTGFMPFKRQYGYIFADNLQGATPQWTIAHELAHGAFRLRHTFSPEANYAAKGSTKNLLDYSNGTYLKKYQWDLMRNQENMNGWLEADSEFASKGDVTVRCISPAVAKIKTQEYYYNLDKKIILLNSNYEPFAFAAAEETDHNPGSLAIIRRKSDQVLFYATESHDYYSFTPEGKADKKFVEFTENNSEVPTVVLIDKNCNYTITRSGQAEIKSKAASCECFGSQDGSGSGSQPVSQIIDKTNEKIDVSEIKELFAGNKSYEDPALGKLQSSVAYLYLTSEAYPDAIAEVQNAKVPEGVIKIWLHKNKYGVWIIKEGANTGRLNEVYASKLKSDFTFDLNQELQAQNSNFTQIATAAYKISDWLSGKINTLLIPEAWWNCDDPNFNPPWFVAIVRKIISPMAIIVDQYIKIALPENSRLSNELEKISMENLNFALSVGLWDGLVSLVNALPETISLATMSFSSDPKARAQTEKFAQLIDDNGGGLIGTMKMVFNGIVDQFDYKRPCILAHSVGSLAFDVIVAIFTAGSGAAASKLGNIAKTLLTTLDKLDVLGNAVGSVVGCGLKVAFKSGSKVLTFTVRNGIKFLEASFDGTKYVIRAFDAITHVVSDIDWSLVKEAYVIGADGKGYKLPVFVDPSKNIEDALYRINKILKDETGTDIKGGKKEILVEVEDLNTGEKEIAAVQSDFVDGSDLVEMSTIRSDLKGSVYPGTNVLYLERIIEYAGKKIKGVFPKFDFAFETRIAEDLYLSTDYKQFTACTKALNEEIKRNPQMAAKFTAEQLEDIANGREKIRGYTWHHNEEPGVMQLVDEEVHGIARHTGGKKIWGGER
jgi:hypothetical protein